MSHVQHGSYIERGDSNRPCPRPDRNWQRSRCCQRYQCRSRFYRTRFRSIVIRRRTYYELRQRHRDEPPRCNRCIAGARRFQCRRCSSPSSVAPTTAITDVLPVTVIHQTSPIFLHPLADDPTAETQARIRCAPNLPRHLLNCNYLYRGFRVQPVSSYNRYIYDQRSL